MRILYIGWISQCEFSLWREGQGNPCIEVISYASGSCPSLATELKQTRWVKSRGDINKIKSELNPDLTLMRTWSPTSNWVSDKELMWSTEIHPADSSGKSLANPLPQRAVHVAYGNKITAQEKGQYWLPYCVSKYYEKRSTVKDIPIMLAANLPGYGKSLKLKSLEILARPVVNNMPELLYTYPAWRNGLYSVGWLGKTFKPAFQPVESCAYAGRARIYLSPTTIWHDAGAISQKTVQAMACGTLVITNKYPGIEDIVGKDGDTIVYANTPEETLEKVKFYLDNEDARKAVENRAHEFMHEEYNWEKHLTRLISEL